MLCLSALMVTFSFLCNCSCSSSFPSCSRARQAAKPSKRRKKCPIQKDLVPQAASMRAWQLPRRCCCAGRRYITNGSGVGRARACSRSPGPDSYHVTTGTRVHVHVHVQAGEGVGRCKERASGGLQLAVRPRHSIGLAAFPRLQLPLLARALWVRPAAPARLFAAFIAIFFLCGPALRGLCFLFWEEPVFPRLFGFLLLFLREPRRATRVRAFRLACF
ncbi:uncharacterized protein K452DRAFT_77438 [Aplosporella prunicola CBS 121167]|uniref:Secreted protein n=1 Tax=Aplosporella prunicola CBS 121167 TaxID=1176127 RepID=A0A6A6B6E5_9PEZI|nr:uncharacterized protein K452DRAFT_77438 [Aplosporella prunicola CBS 121167]KAF2139436.1 hypothetical protein K452DRAFT_77438 [Aplosporella prunicola CBS 121167]